MNVIISFLLSEDVKKMNKVELMISLEIRVTG